jgi:hypothetical protein
MVKGGTSRKYGRIIKCMRNFDLEILKERGYLINIGVKGRITLNWNLTEIAREGVVCL